jgi:phospholipid transport system substrate-binding protein
MPHVTFFQILIAALILLSSSVAAAIEDPQQMVRETGDRILAELTERRTELEADPRRIYPLVERTVLPHFDFRFMSQSAMGRFWRQASDEQKLGITEQFRELLVRTYATALLGYTGQQIEYLPVNFTPGDTKVVIPTRIAANDAPAIPINYRLRLNGEQRWQVYDVVIDGVSLITNYRSQFTNVIRRQGIDGLITSLAAKNNEPSDQ